MAPSGTLTGLEHFGRGWIAVYGVQGAATDAEYKAVAFPGCPVPFQ